MSGEKSYGELFGDGDLPHEGLNDWLPQAQSQFERQLSVEAHNEGFNETKNDDIDVPQDVYNADDDSKVADVEAKRPKYNKRYEYELYLNYKKLRIILSLIFLMSIGFIIGGIATGFYSFKGILTNSVFMVCVLFGIWLSIYNDNKSLEYAKIKLRLLLLYFIMSCLFIFVLLVLSIIYGILIPIREYNDTFNGSTTVVVFFIIFYIISLICWMIFTGFYLDILARCCLKRGRINYIIYYLIHKITDEYSELLNESVHKGFWYRIYKFVIIYRVNFRLIRWVLYNVIGFKFFISSKKDGDKQNYEENKAIAFINNDAGFGPGTLDNNTLKYMKIDESTCKCCITCLDIILCPFIWPCKMLQACVDSKLLYYIGVGLVVAPILYIFLPIIVIITLLATLYAGSKAGGNGAGLILVFGAIAVGAIWFTLWYLVICPEPDFSGTYWQVQCALWNIENEIFIYIIIIFGDSSSSSY